MAITRHETLVLTTVAICLLMLFGGPMLRSPDGAEMLGLAAMWLGQDVQVASPGFWPPLWPLLNLPAVAMGHGEEGARLLGFLLIGLSTAPMYRLARLLGGVGAARLAVLAYLGLPATWEYAAILDARPLSALLFTFAAADVVEATRGERGWTRPFVVAMLALLARPEGILLPVLVAGAAVLAGVAVWRAVLGVVACQIPNLLLGLGSRALTGHEPLLAPWFRTWPVADMLSLMGPASVPTSFRAFTLGLVDEGVVAGAPSPIELFGLVIAAPIGIGTASLTLASAVGFLGMTAAIIGLISVLPRKRRLWVLGLLLAPFSLVSIAPMAQGQAGPVANLLFLLPPCCVALAIGISAARRHRALPVGALALILMEAWFNPLRAQPPYFIEGGEAAQQAVVKLREAPPESGVVATGISGRSIVIRSGLTVAPLSTPWLSLGLEPGTTVLISSVDLMGEDGGRARSLIEDPGWMVEWVVADGDIALAQGRVPALDRMDRGWFALLKPVELPAD